ncbi:MAG TPA: serine/threonine-protein kinase, partial [Marisediminicola sp.]|nr:serine/threonine-protein kinase [Marisediminicola sp.]
NDQVRQMFQAEANLMAQLSAHPSILTVYQASVSSDGRPYIVMEFCSSGLSERYRRERIPVPEILRIAVKIGSAIETAHRVGVLHRDIKPSNILLTAYGHPVLSDFGIASTLGEADNQEAVGMSIPWSAPEVLADETPGTIESEVWSFAATVYSLLAGRSPFEVPGGSNASADLMARIAKARVQPIGRPDVPASLERTLQAAMSRKPDARPPSILELVRELQAVESELGMPQTPIEVAMNEWALGGVADLEDKTKIRSVASAVPPQGGRRRRRSVGDSEYAAVGTIVRGTSPSLRGTGTATITATPRRVRWLAWSLVAAVVLIIALAAAVTVTFARASTTSIPVVTDISASSTSDSVEFSWTDPGLRPSDTYQVTATDQEPSIQSRPEFTAAAEDGQRVCIVVTVNRDGITGPASGEKCLDFSS